MAGEAPSTDVQPLPKFYFSVTGLSAGTVCFQEVTGLANEPTQVEYRHADSPNFDAVKMPGIGSASKITLRKGIFVNDTALGNLFNQVKLNTIKRLTIVVSLLDQTATPQMVWTLNNAFPTKISSTDLKSEGNEVAVESVEIAFETMTISAP